MDLKYFVVYQSWFVHLNSAIVQLRNSCVVVANFYIQANIPRLTKTKQTQKTPIRTRSPPPQPFHKGASWQIQSNIRSFSAQMYIKQPKSYIM